MEAAFTYTAADLAAAQQWARSQASAWGVQSSIIDWSLTAAARQIDAEQVGRVVLEYDPPQHLLSIDVFCDGARLYGMDDFV